MEVHHDHHVNPNSCNVLFGIHVFALHGYLLEVIDYLVPGNDALRCFRWLGDVQIRTVSLAVEISVNGT